MHPGSWSLPMEQIEFGQLAGYRQAEKRSAGRMGW
jgi:hypothetical protein